MKITEIRVDDYMAIRKLKAQLGKINIVTGPNEGGKSSLLFAIREAFESSGHDVNLIHNQADKSEIVLLLDNGIEIQRKITKSGNSVKVVQDDAPVSKPVAFLKAILGDTAFNFNPVEFILKKNIKERREMLLKSIDVKLSADFLKEIIGDDALLSYLTENGFDYSRHGLEVIEQMQALIYNKRKEQNIKKTQLEKAIQQDKADLPKTVDSEKFKDFDFNKKMNELRDAESEINQHNADVKDLSNMQSKFDRIDAEIKELESKIALLKAQKEQLYKAGKDLSETVKAFTPKDVESMRQEIQEYQANVEIIAKMKEIEKRENNLDEESAIHADLDRLYKIITSDVPKRLLADAKLPAENLEFRDNDIFVNGVQIDKLSTEAKVNFSVEMAKRLSGKLKVICIDNFECMDPEHTEAFMKAAESDDYEYFIAKVSTTPGEKLKVEVSDEPKQANLKV